jgi:hypothetical protein
VGEGEGAGLWTQRRLERCGVRVYVSREWWCDGQYGRCLAGFCVAVPIHLSRIQLHVCVREREGECVIKKKSENGAKWRREENTQEVSELAPLPLSHFFSLFIFAFCDCKGEEQGKRRLTAFLGQTVSSLQRLSSLNGFKKNEVLS